MAKVVNLWDQEFRVVREGLDRDEVEAFIQKLKEDHKPAMEPGYVASLKKLAEQTVIEADKMGMAIKEEARRDAEAQASKIISEAQQKARQIIEEAVGTSTAASTETANIMRAAGEKAAQIEERAKEEADRMVERSREIVQKEIEGSFNRAYQRLFSDLQDLVKEARELETNLKAKVLGASSLSSEEVKVEEEAEIAGIKTEAEKEDEMRVEVERAWAEAKERLEREAIGREELKEGAMMAEDGYSGGNGSAPPTEPVGVKFPQELFPSVKEEGAIAIEQTEEPHLSLEEDIRSLEMRDEIAELASDKELVALAWEEENLKPQGHKDVSLYQGTVELVIAPPVDFVQLKELQRCLERSSLMKVVGTEGTSTGGTSITLSLDRPLPLVSVLSDLPMVKEAVASSNGSPEHQTLVITMRRN